MPPPLLACPPPRARILTHVVESTGSILLWLLLELTKAACHAEKQRLGMSSVLATT